MKHIILLLCTTILLGCSNKDEEPDYSTGENSFSATFRGQTIVPERLSSGGVGRYTLSVNRNENDNRDWLITIGGSVGLNLEIRLLDIIGVGSYSIETANLDEINNFYLKTVIFLSDDVTLQYTDLSIGNSGSFNITEYDSVKGILVGTFSCDMYDTTDPSIITPIEGKFNINLETLPL